MAVNLLTILQSIRQKTDELSARCLTLDEELRQRDHTISELQFEIERLKKENASLKSDNEFLTVSHRLASSPDEIVKSRRLLAGWIRDIDRCIAQLKE